MPLLEKKQKEEAALYKLKITIYGLFEQPSISFKYELSFGLNMIYFQSQKKIFDNLKSLKLSKYNFF